MRRVVADEALLAELQARQAQDLAAILPQVGEICRRVEREGDAALRELRRSLDGATDDRLVWDERAIAAAAALCPEDVRAAIDLARANIEAFHRAARPADATIETRPGVRCTLRWDPIDRVGLYVPGGTAPLVSTLLMLAVPARAAGCRVVEVCTPPRPEGLAPAIAYACQKLEIARVGSLGGAYAIAAMAYGTDSIRRVDKIFGPGNRWVTAAKAFVSAPPRACAIDALAGPSELCVIASGDASPKLVAAELLAQAEHGADANVILLTDEPALLDAVEAELAGQVASAARRELAAQALAQSVMVRCRDLEEARVFAEAYAPEHLWLACDEAAKLLPRIRGAGAIFVGRESSVAFGDYSAGPNHTLPTGGAARATGPVTLASFLKPTSVLEVSVEGRRALSAATRLLASVEGLAAHGEAVAARETAS